MNAPPLNESLRSLEASFVETIALMGGVDRDRVKVTLTPEDREGQEGVKIDVLVDGQVSPEGEAIVAEMIGVAMGAAQAVLAIGGAS